jgi:GntR family transcriptional regulator
MSDGHRQGIFYIPNQAAQQLLKPTGQTWLTRHYHRHQREGRPGFAAQMEEQGHTSRQDILEVGRAPAPAEVAQRLGVEEGADVVMRRLRFVVDDVPVQLVRVYYQPRLVAGSKLEQPVPIPDGVHADEEGPFSFPAACP